MKNKFVLTSLMVIAPFFAHAGVISGGGGKGVVCRNPDGSIQSAETLDLYEGRALYGLQSPIESNEPVEAQVQKALQKIPAINRGMTEHYVKSVLKGLRLAPAGSELTQIDDSFEAVLPKDCKAEQLANYYNDNLILVNSDIWNSLSETNKAALILHEAFYASERIYGAKDSRRTRHVVANIFDHSSNWVDPKDQVPAGSLLCMTDKGGFFAWAFPNQEHGGWTMQFQILGGNQVMSKKKVWFSGKDLDFNEAKTHPIIKGDDLIGTGFTTSATVQSNFEDHDVLSLRKKWEAIKDTNGVQIPGYQTPRYYVSWTSGTYPGTSKEEAQLNCSVQLLP